VFVFVTEGKEEGLIYFSGNFYLILVISKQTLKLCL